MMRRPPLLLPFGVVLLVAGMTGCPESVVSDVCVSDSDCAVGKVCENKVCVVKGDGGPADGGGPDAGVLDAGSDGGLDAGLDGGEPDGGLDAGPRPDAGPYDGGSIDDPCTLSGSWVHDSTGMHLIGNDPADAVGAPSGAHDTYPGSWLQLPEGFCAHHYANVPNARQLRFAPGGELFVASPTKGTTGGGFSQLKAIIVVPDDNLDGVGDSLLHYKDNLPATQGMMFTDGYFYYQDNASTGTCSLTAGTAIYREPYVPGQRVSPGNPEKMMTVNQFCSDLHWPKTLDISDSGHIFVGNGGDQNEACLQPDMPFHGGILELDGSTNGNPVVKGLRNPIDVKCHRDGHDICFATELALDYSAGAGGREKLIPIRHREVPPNDLEDWGFPCCATQNLPYANITANCAGVQPDSVSFRIGDTPFGFDFIDEQFAAPWDHKVFVALHGAFGTWVGARIVSIDIDPATGLTYESSTVDGGANSGHMKDFINGYDDRHQLHGRPADIAIAHDGRLFVANDVNGEIYWVAPIRN